MAISNVRFYKLETLPSFEVPKHQGIFVHVTKPMHNTTWTLSNKETQIDPKTLWMEPEKSGGSVERINLVKWLSTRHITEIASGLWFGGENGWELLSNDTSSGAITAAIEALDVNGYAQAEITTATNSSTLTIKGIKEVDGKIGIPVDTENRDLNIKIDGVYTESNKIATQSTVTTAIEALDVNTAVQAVIFNTSEVDGNTTLTFKGIKEVDGKIAQGDEQTPNTFIVGDAKLKIQIGSDEAGAFEVFSANAEENGIIKLDGNVFKKNVVDGKNVLSIYTTEGVSSTNPLVTQNDINGLVGAMHYRGGVTSLPTANENTKKGDVWIVITAFGEYEVGDMFIARADGASATFDTVQGNLTLGTGIGKVAANSAALVDGNLVVATGTGIETIEFDKDNLISDDRNKRDLSYTNGAADTTGDITLYHDVTITDALTVIGKPFTKSIKISSANRSIKIARNAGDNDSTGVIVDLVWNTSIE